MAVRPLPDPDAASITLARCRVLATAVVFLGLMAAGSTGADTGSGVSPGFPLYLGAGFHEPPTIGVSSAVSPAFVLYLGAGFQAPPDIAVASGFGPAFALWLGRLSEGTAVSPVTALDTRYGDPSFVAAPDHLEAVAIPCSDLVRMSWADNSSDETGFEIQDKPAGFDVTWYTRLAVEPAGTTSYTYSPGDGLSHTYRVRAIRVLASSAYSNEATVRTDGMNGPPAPPTGFVVKSSGDARMMRAHLWPPEGAADWKGVSAVLIFQYAEDFDHLVASIIKPLDEDAEGEQIVDGFVGDPDVEYYFRATCINSLEQSGAAATTGPISPRLAPILLVHGIWSNGDVWGPIWSNGLRVRGYEAQRWNAITFPQPGASWVSEVLELRDAVSELLSGDWATDELVDIVAHSQGGLVARMFVEKLRSGRHQVRNLVMLGTPNHGGRFSTLATWCGFAEKSPGVYDLITNSSALRWLNFGNLDQKDKICADSPSEAIDNGLVTYYTLAGTGPSLIRCEHRPDIEHLLCWLEKAEADDPVGWCSSDGVVPWKSVRLRTLSPSNQWLDTELCDLTTGLVHSSIIAYPPESVGMLESPAVVDFVLDILDGGDLPCRNPHTPARLEDSSEGAGGGYSEPTFSLISSTTDSLGPSGTRTYEAPVDSSEGVAFFASWEDSPVTIRLISPDSTIFVPADTAAVPGLQYERDDTLGYVALAMLNPVPGTWRAEVITGGGPGLTHYTVDWVAQDGGLRLSGGADPEVVDPGEPVVLTATLSQDGAPMPAATSAVVTSPSGVRLPVTLVDDGTAGDSMAVDGTYTGTIAAPNEDGVCTVAISSETSLPVGGTAARFIERTFSVVKQPDLTLSAADIRWAPRIGFVGRNAELCATIHNVGNAGADTVAVTFENLSTGAILGQIRVAVAAGDSAIARILWVPSVRGKHQVTVSVARVGGVERDVTNNTAEVVLPVAGPTPTAGVGESETVSPARPWFAPPFPNPFRSRVVLEFDVASPGPVRLRVFDVQGRLIRTLVTESLPAGRYTRAWDGVSDAGAPVGSGFYFIQMVAPEHRQTRKVLLLR